MSTLEHPQRQSKPNFICLNSSPYHVIHAPISHSELTQPGWCKALSLSCPLSPQAFTCLSFNSISVDPLHVHHRFPSSLGYCCKILHSFVAAQLRREDMLSAKQMTLEDVWASEVAASHVSQIFCECRQCIGLGGLPTACIIKRCKWGQSLCSHTFLCIGLRMPSRRLSCI